MKGKYAVIAVLLAGLGALVWTLVRMERGRARPQVIRIVEPARGPVEIEASREEVLAAAAGAEVRFRCAGSEFEHLAVTSNPRGEKTESWQKLFVVGVNLGAALPGRYPNQFAATREDYRRWLDQMGEAGINLVRTYTILPPEFYRALADHNFRNSERPVYLLQGVWTELPGSYDLFDPEFTRACRQEIRDAVDVVAGRAVLPEHRGRASGTYSADVSAFTLGWLFGREWELDVVSTTDTAHPSARRHDGIFFSVPDGSPTAVWLAGMLDYLVQYEVLSTGVQRPVAFINWLPLDPMYHSTEYAERWRGYESDNDIVNLDPEEVQTTPVLRSGYYAAYHVYPYYPDFVFREPAYRDHRNARGEPDAYAGYLKDLKRHHAGLPLLVAEFGVPSSRGSSHHSWLGMNHGGHDEAEQARMNLAMLAAIHDEGCAGGIVFAWLDEWFKRNWLIDDFVVPAERSKLWHNVQNPEECFGMVGFGRGLRSVDGDPADWTGKPLARARGENGIRSLWAASDEEYCYLRLDFARPPDWTRESVGVAIDTYDPRAGDTRLGPVGLDCAQGAEFLVLFADTGDAEVLVDSTYSVYYDPYLSEPPLVRTVANRDGAFVTERLISNHLRLTAAGETIPSYTTEYGRLRYGCSSDNSLADWCVRDRVLEVRLPWALINVSDPSSFQVLQDDPEAEGIQSATTKGFAFSAFITESASPGEVASALPGSRDGVLRFTRRWRWEGWEEPAYEERLKDSYYLFAAGLPRVLADSEPRLAALARPKRPTQVAARLARFQDDSPAAVSVTFDDGSYDLFERAVPLLGRYRMRAGFGLVADWTDATASWHAERDGIPFLRMGIPEAKRLLEAGHTIAAHGLTHVPDSAARPERVAPAVATLDSALGTIVHTWHYPYSAAGPATVEAVRRAGLWFGRTAGDRYNPATGFDRYRLMSFPCYNETLPGLDDFIRIIESGRDRWTILLHHHVLEPDSRELQTMLRHGVTDTYSVTPLTFGRHLRLVRNSGAWVAPIEDVGRYLLQFERARLDLRRSARSASVRIDGVDTEDLPPVPMTVVLDVPWDWVSVTGSVADGVYSPRTGRLMLRVLPGQDVVLSRLARPDSL